MRAWFLFACAVVLCVTTGVVLMALILSALQWAATF